MPIDLSQVTVEELMTIHNEVLRNIALQTRPGSGTPLGAAHDSHSSNHANNKIVDLQSQVGIVDLQSQVADVFRRQGQQR